MFEEALLKLFEKSKMFPWSKEDGLEVGESTGVLQNHGEKVQEMSVTSCTYSQYCQGIILTKLKPQVPYR